MDRLENHKGKHRKFPKKGEKTILETWGNVRRNGEKRKRDCP